MWRVTIRRKLILLTSCLVAAVSLFIYLYFPTRFEAQELRGMRNKAHSIAAMTAFNTVAPLVFEDKEGAAEALQGAAKDPDVVYVVVVDMQDRVFAAYGFDAARRADFHAVDEEARRGGDVLKARETIRHNDAIIGELFIGLTLEGQRALAQKSRRAVAAVSMTVLVVGILTAAIFGAFLTRPLALVARTAEEIAEGRLNQRAPVASSDEVGDLARSFNMMAERVEAAHEDQERLNRELLRSNRELEQFAYIASHDLKEPLRTIANCVQLLERQYGAVLGDAGAELVGYASDGAIRMSLLLDSLLLYSRVGRQGQDLETTDARAAVESVVESLAATISEAEAEVVIGELPTLTANRSLLEQLFQNLLANALKFRRGGIPALVRIDATRHGNSWKLSVEDNGIGIEEKHFERLFRAFHRLHTHDEYPGVGMGLAIASKIVEWHGGTIWLESTVGQGSTFWFTIPDRSSTDVEAGPQT